MIILNANYYYKSIIKCKIVGLAILTYLSLYNGISEID